MKVLVTGGAGYIGLELCRQLLARGDSVRVVDRLFFGGEHLREMERHSEGRLTSIVGANRSSVSRSSACSPYSFDFEYAPRGCTGVRSSNIPGPMPS